MNTLRGEAEINIGGQVRPLKFNLNSSALFTQVTGKELSDITFNVGDMRDFIWAGLAEGARRKGIAFDADRYDVGDWLEDIDEGEMQKVNDALLAANNVGEVTEKAKKK